jgi:hypothetical protein
MTRSTHQIPTPLPLFAAGARRKTPEIALAHDPVTHHKTDF